MERGKWDRATAALQPVFDSASTVNLRLIGAAEFNAAVVAEGQKNWDEAEARYLRSLEIRIAQEQTVLIVDSLAGMLRVAIEQGDHDAIRTLAHDIRHRLDSHGTDGIEHPGRLFVTLVRAWDAMRDMSCSRYYLEQGVAFVMERANRLDEPSHRTSYMENVPAHRQLIAMAKDAGMLAA